MRSFKKPGTLLHFLMTGRMPSLSPSSRRVTDNYMVTIEGCLSYLFLERFLHESCSTNFHHMLKTFYLRHSVYSGVEEIQQT